MADDREQTIGGAERSRRGYRATGGSGGSGGSGGTGLGEAREWEPLGHGHHRCPVNSDLEGCNLGYPGSPSLFLEVGEVGKRVDESEAQLWVDELVVGRA